MTRGGDRRSEEFSIHQNDEMKKPTTKEIIAKQFGVGSATVERAEHFLDGLNEAEKEQRPYFSTKFRKTPLKGGKA